MQGALGAVLLDPSPRRAPPTPSQPAPPGQPDRRGAHAPISNRKHREHACSDSESTTKTRRYRTPPASALQIARTATATVQNPVAVLEERTEAKTVLRKHRERSPREQSSSSSRTGSSSPCISGGSSIMPRRRTRRVPPHSRTASRRLFSLSADLLSSNVATLMLRCSDLAPFP
jgi:hypothetical protein